MSNKTDADVNNDHISLQLEAHKPNSEYEGNQIKLKQQDMVAKLVRCENGTYVPDTNQTFFHYGKIDFSRLTFAILALPKSSGKRLIVLNLIHSNKPPPTPHQSHPTQTIVCATKTNYFMVPFVAVDEFEQSKSTLILVPNQNIANKWVQDCRKFGLETKLKITIASVDSHDPPKNIDEYHHLMMHSDIVLATATAVNVLMATKPHLRFWRYVVDEAHTFKNTDIQRTISARFKWFMTRDCESLCTNKKNQTKNGVFGMCFNGITKKDLTTIHQLTLGKRKCLYESLVVSEYRASYAVSKYVRSVLTNFVAKHHSPEDCPDKLMRILSLPSLVPLVVHRLNGYQFTVEQNTIISCTLMVLHDLRDYYFARVEGMKKSLDVSESLNHLNFSEDTLHQEYEHVCISLENVTATLIVYRSLFSCPICLVTVKDVTHAFNDENNVYSDDGDDQKKTQEDEHESYGPLHKPCVTVCDHYFCVECLKRHVRTSGRNICPYCRTDFRSWEEGVIQLERPFEDFPKRFTHANNIKPLNHQSRTVRIPSGWSFPVLPQDALCEILNSLEDKVNVLVIFNGAATRTETYLNDLKTRLYQTADDINTYVAKRGTSKRHRSICAFLEQTNRDPTQNVKKNVLFFEMHGHKDTQQYNFSSVSVVVFFEDSAIIYDHDARVMVCKPECDYTRCNKRFYYITPSFDTNI